MSKCNHCQGTIANLDWNEARCLNCGREKSHRQTGPHKCKDCVGDIRQGELLKGDG